MIATVTRIESGRDYEDGRRRIRLTFCDAHSHHGSLFSITTTDATIGIVGLTVDDQIEVTFRPVREAREASAG